jgi:hypothetical protein
MVTIQELDQKLEVLRMKYQTAAPSMRPIIQRQARALQIAKEKIERRRSFSR